MKIELDIAPHYNELTIKIGSNEMNDEVMNLMQRLKETKPQSFIGKTEQKWVPLQLTDIILFYTEDQKVWADSLKGTFEMKQKLYELENQLEGTSFVRISKGVIANIHHMRDIEVFFNGSLVVNFKNNRQEIISRRYVNQVKQTIGMGVK